MNKMQLKNMLDDVAAGKITSDEAIMKMKTEPYKNLGFAKVDHHRSVRQGAAEVIYGECKTGEQILKIICSMLNNGEKSVLVTRLNEDKANYLKEKINIKYDSVSKTAVAGETEIKAAHGKIVVVTGGTSDIPVAEEAALTAEFYGNKVLRIYDVGVAGIHRLFDNAGDLADAKVIVAVAGMEGALASVVGGMVDCPVIAVPTSVGYGANFKGLSALLSMLNSCASGVSVVNIDNGFGAGYIASMINKI